MLVALLIDLSFSALSISNINTNVFLKVLWVYFKKILFMSQTGIESFHFLHNGICLFIKTLINKVLQRWFKGFTYTSVLTVDCVTALCSVALWYWSTCPHSLGKIIQELTQKFFNKSKHVKWSCIIPLVDKSKELADWLKGLREDVLSAELIIKNWSFFAWCITDWLRLIPTCLRNCLVFVRHHKLILYHCSSHS
jgi:hypothetical protein